MTKPRFNVAFHGLFVFVQRPSRIDVLVPDMGSQHVYRAGEWLGEITFCKGDYAMTIPEPVSGGPAAFDPARNIVVKGARPSKSARRPAKVYARFSFPRPQKIHSLRSIELNAVQLSHDAGLEISSRTVSVVQVFTYEGMDAPDVALEGIRLPERGGNLHIIAGPDQRETEQHTHDGFTTATSLFRATRGRMRLSGSPQAPQITDAEVPEGMHALELVDLKDRVRHLAAFGRQLRASDRRRIDGRAILSVPGDISALDTDIRACLGIIGDPGTDD